jgi:hypothetical protein
MTTLEKFSVESAATQPFNAKSASMTRYLVRQGTNGWMIWDRKAKGPAIVLTRELTEFESGVQARSALEYYLAIGALVEPH